MRITVPFSSKKIPLAYRMMIVSIIKESLRNADQDYYQQLYGVDKEKMKPFATAVYLKNFQIQDDIINLEELNLTISSPDQEFILHVYNGLLQINQFEYQGFTLNRKKIRSIPEKTIRSTKVVFRTLSPILIEDKKREPLSPEDPDYAKNVNYYADLILANYRGVGLQQDMVVKPGMMQKQVIKESNQEFKQTPGTGKWLYFTGYKGYLQLEGNSSDLQLLYQLGLSKRRGQSFGLLELEREEV